MAKATKKQALGRGLSALLNDPSNDIKSAQDKNADKVVGNIIDLEIESIQVNPHQPRTYFNDEALQELASSIKELGVIQPITVRKIDFNEFQLVSGERRFRASKIAGLTHIPAYVRIANDQESLEMALVENIQRQDLDPIEIAQSYQRLIDEIQLTQEKLSERVGKKRSTIANYLRLLKLDPIVQTGIRDGFISMGHGRAIINFENPKDQIALYEKIIKNNLSVRETEKLAQEKGTKTSTKTKAEKPSFIAECETALASKLDAKVQLTYTPSGAGKLVVHFKSESEFNRIQKALLSE